jgi:hypothetical protein
MIKRIQDTVRRGAVTGKTVGIYALLWLLGVPGILLVILFLFGVGR